MMTVYSAPCSSCAGAHLGKCGVYLGHIARLVTSIAATTALVVIALITAFIR